ncbi:MAG: phosphoribosylanthranilate isomerase [Alphaproteobacteria bacterium]
MNDVDVKICGVRDEAALSMALDMGAAYVGFVFYPPSPRALTPAEASPLCQMAEGGTKRVGLIVDATDIDIAQILGATTLDMLQLHGAETPERVRQVRRRFGLPVIKAIPIAATADLDFANSYRDSADMLLFDAKPPNRPDALPGGNAETFDWNILNAKRPAGPWMLSGGLTTENVAAAIAAVTPPAVDVSSGVERSRGVKDPALIRAFIEAARTAA